MSSHLKITLRPVGMRAKLPAGRDLAADWRAAGFSEAVIRQGLGIGLAKLLNNTTVYEQCK